MAGQTGERAPTAAYPSALRVSRASGKTLAVLSRDPQQPPHPALPPDSFFPPFQCPRCHHNRYSNRVRGRGDLSYPAFSSPLPCAFLFHREGVCLNSTSLPCPPPPAGAGRLSPGQGTAWLPRVRLNPAGPPCVPRAPEGPRLCWLPGLRASRLFIFSRFAHRSWLRHMALGFPRPTTVSWRSGPHLLSEAETQTHAPFNRDRLHLLPVTLRRQSSKGFLSFENQPLTGCLSLLPSGRSPEPRHV